MGSPITVKQPPTLAAMTMAEPMSMRWRRDSTMPCITTSIIVAVVRLSRLAEMIKVQRVSVQMN